MNASDNLSDIILRKYVAGLLEVDSKDIHDYSSFYELGADLINVYSGESVSERKIPIIYIFPRAIRRRNDDIKTNGISL